MNPCFFHIYLILSMSCCWHTLTLSFVLIYYHYSKRSVRNILADQPSVIPFDKFYCKWMNSVVEDFKSYRKKTTSTFVAKFSTRPTFLKQIINVTAYIRSHDINAHHRISCKTPELIFLSWEYLFAPRYWISVKMEINTYTQTMTGILHKITRTNDSK